MKISEKQYRYIISAKNIFLYSDFKKCKEEANISNIIRNSEYITELEDFNFDDFYIYVFDSKKYICTYMYNMAHNTIILKNASEDISDLLRKASYGGNGKIKVNRDDMLVNFASVKSDIDAYIRNCKAILVDNLLITMPKFFKQFSSIAPLDAIIDVVKNVGIAEREVGDYLSNYPDIDFSQYKLDLGNKYNAKFVEIEHSMYDTSFVDYYNQFKLEVNKGKSHLITFDCSILSNSDFEINIKRKLDKNKNKKLLEILDLLNKNTAALDSIFINFLKTYNEDFLIKCKSFIGGEISRYNSSLKNFLFSVEEREEFYNKLIERLLNNENK